MSLRTRKITRGEHKGETGYSQPPTLDDSIPASQRAMVRHHINAVSFFVEPNLFVNDGRVYSRKGPRSKYSNPEGSVYEVWPLIFNRLEVENLRAIHATKRKTRQTRKRAKR
jgi:hypothetical protein